jgi:Leucine-rich repeat (LRR) protein
MHKELLAILVLSVLVTSTVVGCDPSPSTLTILSTTEGDVSVMKAGTTSWIAAQGGMSLEAGDSVKTGNDSSAEITFFDGSTIELQAGTEIEIASLDVSRDTGSTTITLEQTIGNTISRVTKIVDPASRYEVETPTGVVAVRGSAMQVYVIEDGTTLATNLEGDIWAVAQGVEVQIPQGQQCVIRPGQPPNLEVTFADPNLEAVIREAIAIPEGPIYPSDLEALASLNASEKSIADLTGLEHCTSLTDLNLSRNDISDISPLASLTNLTTVDLWFNQIGDISPLANLTSLITLNLVNNQISDISPLTDLTSLTWLWLHDNQISDISPLANFTSLTGLGLNRNQISDISPLANLTSLTWLWLAHNQISDISPLAGLTSLTILWLHDNQISDIAPLAGLTSLTELGLHSNHISDIFPLVENPGLSTGDAVNLEMNPLSSDSINTYIPELEARGVTVYH